MQHDWIAIGLALLAISISLADVICRRRDRVARGNYIQQNLALSPTSPLPKPRKK